MAHWGTLDVWTLNLKKYGIPQSRERVFIIGRSNLFKEISGVPLLVKPREVEGPKLLSFLNSELVQDRDLTPKMIDNLNKYKDRMAKHSDREYEVASFSVDRDPTKNYKSNLYFDLMHTITVQNRYLYVVGKPSSDVEKLLGVDGRKLHVEERSRLQGVVYESLRQTAGKSDIIQLLGNTMSFNILQRVFVSALSLTYSIELCDPWLDGSAVGRLRDDVQWEVGQQIGRAHV